jgi:hypothetical protein
LVAVFSAYREPDPYDGPQDRKYCSVKGIHRLILSQPAGYVQFNHRLKLQHIWGIIN